MCLRQIISQIIAHRGIDTIAADRASCSECVIFGHNGSHSHQEFAFERVASVKGADLGRFLTRALHGFTLSHIAFGMGPEGHFFQLKALEADDPGRHKFGQDSGV